MAIALAVTPTVRAEDGAPAGTTDAAQAQPAGVPASDQAAGAGASPSEAAGQAAPGSASSQATTGGAADSATASQTDGPTAGSTESGSQGSSQAEGHPASQAAGNANDSAPAGNGAGAHDPDNAPANDSSPGNSGSAPDPGNNSSGNHGQPTSDSEQDTSIGQAADAAAAADQKGVGNGKASVRVNEPGNGSPVSQANHAEAAAEATAAAETSAPATSDQSAGAVAEAAQADVQNTSVNVRVGSPGDDAAVEQANLATANASTSVTAPEDGESTVDESAAAVATQDGVTNTNVSVRVFSPGSDGTVTQTNTAVAAAGTSGPDGATAAASQDDVQNTNVSVRVESPGTSGAVTQQSAASADDGLAISTTTNGLDTNLSVVVDGDQLQQPGANGLQVWIWTWNWERDESQAADALLATPPSTWNWAWDGTNGGPPGQVTSQTAGNHGQAAGQWTWNWTWTRDGAPNWMWQWDWNALLPCGSCVWIWNWTWTWTGQPAPTGSTASGVEIPNNSETADQANVAVADAQASVTADVTQEIAQDAGGSGEQFAGQLVSIDQIANATATATQTDVGTVATANLLGAQVNRVTSTAFVAIDADVAQHVEQTMLVGEDGSGATQWSGQEIDVVQRGHADVRSAQRDVVLRAAGTVVAAGDAAAAIVLDVDQSVVQDALVDGGTNDQWAGQLTLVEQAGDAASVVEQTGAAASRLVGGTARARSSSGALARVDQGLGQRAVRGGGLGSQTAMQSVYVGQNGSSSATTTQQAGSARSSLAASEAIATNRALVVQEGAQDNAGTSGFDIQHLQQQAIVVQTAVAMSLSAGGIAGTAVVGNCAIVQQSAGQSIRGGTVSAAMPDLSAFCAPPSVAPTAGMFAEAEAAAASAAAVVTPASVVATALDDLDVALFHGRPSAAVAPTPRAITPRVVPVRPGPGAERPVPGSSFVTQISVPPPTQARLDTRPAGHAGDGDAGKEPPLPPVGGPPSWVSALAAAASGAGPSGIATILLAFTLVPPLVSRARQGSVVRRPIGVFSRADVPV